MKVARLFVIAMMVGTLAVIGCNDEPSGTAGSGGSGTAGSGGSGTAGNGGSGTAGSGGTAGTGGGSGDACAQLLVRCEADCTGGELAICTETANDGEIDACALLLEADPGGCPVDI